VHKDLGEVTGHVTIEKALDELKGIMAKDDELIILGSFITVAEAQDWIEEQNDG